MSLRGCTGERTNNEQNEKSQKSQKSETPKSLASARVQKKGKVSPYLRGVRSIAAIAVAVHRCVAVAVKLHPAAEVAVQNMSGAEAIAKCGTAATSCWRASRVMPIRCASFAYSLGGRSCSIRGSFAASLHAAFTANFRRYSKAQSGQCVNARGFVFIARTPAVQALAMNSCARACALAGRTGRA
jgi:hypothetical protein